MLCLIAFMTVVGAVLAAVMRDVEFRPIGDPAETVDERRRLRAGRRCSAEAAGCMIHKKYGRSLTAWSPWMSPGVMPH